MSSKGLRSLSLSIGSLLPSFSQVAAVGEPAGATAGRDCHGKLCNPFQEYCSAFAETCMPCASICDPNTHNYHADTCAKECSVYKSNEPIMAGINDIKSSLNTIEFMLYFIILVIIVFYAIKLFKWLRSMRCIKKLCFKMLPKSQHSAANGRDLNAITIQNPNAFNRDIERAPSQIYSVAGAAEGSVVTMATPVSTRYPAENSTTPTTVVTEVGYGYGYDNQAMVVTPVTEKPESATTPTKAVF